MPIALGLGLSPVTLSTGVGVGTGLSIIQALFNDGNSRRGYALCPWMLNTLFQERTGASATTPCAVGDPVGTIADVSGQGLYAIAVSDNKRGILRQDAGGHYYVELDGVDDCYKISSITLSTTQYEWLAFDQTDGTKFHFAELSATVASNDGHSFAGTSSSPWAVRRTSLNAAAGVSQWANGPHISERSYVANTGGTYLLDGVAGSNGSISGTARAESDVTDQYNLFSRNQSSLFSKGAWYGRVVCDKVSPSAGQITAIRNLLAQNMEVSL